MNSYQKAIKALTEALDQGKFKKLIWMILANHPAAIASAWEEVKKESEVEK